MGIHLKLIKLDKRNAEKWDKKLNIHAYGEDNAYPNRMERIINGSVTAKTSATVMRKFLKGGGFNMPKELRGVKIGKVGYMDLTPDLLLNRIARDISYHRGVALQRNINANYETASVGIHPFSHVRLSYKDDLNNIVKVGINSNWENDKDKGKFDAKDTIWIDLFNKSQDVLKYQIEQSYVRQYTKKGSESASEVDKINYFKGQVLYYNFDEYGIYPLSPVDVCNLDADTEAQIGLYKNNDLRSGFMLKHIVKYASFKDDRDKEEFERTLQSFLGADANGSFMLVQTEIEGDQNTINLADNSEIKFEKLDQDINDKKWAHYETSCSNNIRKSFNNVPPVLIDFVEGKLGNTSGEGMREAVKFYNQQTQDERDTITELMIKLFSDFKDERFRNPALWEIIPFNYGDAASNV